LAGNPPKPEPKPEPKTENSSNKTADTTAAKSNGDKAEKPKSALEKQAEIALKCAEAFKGATTPIDIKANEAKKEEVKPITINPTKPDGTKMTPEEIKREEEIQKKIRAAVITVPVDNNPTLSEVERVMKEPPLVTVSLTEFGFLLVNIVNVVGLGPCKALMIMLDIYIYKVWIQPPQ
jgi:hypothetical protein